MDNILEIGPGLGALTELLIKNANTVTSIEIDTDLENKLKEKFKNNNNFTLLMGDFMDLDIRSYFKDKNLSKKIKVVANIPYYITSPIINKIIENRDIVSEIFIMVQKEVAERICAIKGKERSVLTLAIEYYGEAKYLFTIPREYFTPVPNVDSAFISISLYQNEQDPHDIPEDVFFKYVKAAFTNKRKTILNNLSKLDIPKDKIKEILDKVGISQSERAENITIEQYFQLIKEFRS